MIRKFNYTGRKLIPLSCVQIYFEDSTKIPYTFNATINLDSLKLPPSADVYVEAYDTSSYMRFPFGKVTQIRPPPKEKRILTEIHSTESIKFRVKVIDNSQIHGRILAIASGIVTSTNQPENSKKIPILPVSYKKMEQEIWRLEFNDGPVLYVNQELIDIGIRESLRSDNSFMGLVYPAIVREILTRIILIEKVYTIEGDEWTHLWLRFICSLPGIQPIPEAEELPLNRIHNADEFINWIDLDAVPAFCKKMNIKDNYMREFKSEVDK